MRKLLYLVIGLLFVFALPSGAQPECVFTHYSSEEGLSQNTVMNILQDRKGNMWFATWDGINKFDGYDFRTYKAKFDNRINLTNKPGGLYVRRPVRLSVAAHLRQSGLAF